MPKPDPPEGLDIRSAIPVSPEEAQLQPLSKAGIDLVRWLLLMVSAFVVISIAWIWISEWRFSNALASLMNRDGPGAMVDTLLKERAAFREFYIKIVQMVLVNVLLPVLTALLGYTFGAYKGQNTSTTDQK